MALQWEKVDVLYYWATLSRYLPIFMLYYLLWSPDQILSSWFMMQPRCLVIAITS